MRGYLANLLYPCRASATVYASRASWLERWPRSTFSPRERAMYYEAPPVVKNSRHIFLLDLPEVGRGSPTPLD
jgi:hypothetical protein